MGTGTPTQIILLSNAQLAHRLAIIGRLVAMAQVSLAEGLWNPEFASADATYQARSICEDLTREVSAIENKL